MRAAYKVVHVCSTLNENSSVVRELLLIDICAVFSNMTAIVDLPGLVIHILDSVKPVPGPLGVLGVSCVTSVAGKPRANVEEAAICDGWYGSALTRAAKGVIPTVLVVIALVGERDLPSQPTIAVIVMTIRVGLGVPHGLCQGKILGPIRRGIWELVLGRQHCRHAPESLIVITQ